MAEKGKHKRKGKGKGERRVTGKIKDKGRR